MDEIKDPRKALARRIKRHVTSQEHTFFAVVQPGFEQAACNELQTLGIDSLLTITEGGIEFKGRLNDCYLVNISSRTIIRIIMRIDGFKATDFTHYKKKLLAIPWELYIKPETHIKSSITSRHSRLYHTGRLEEDLKAALRERLKTHGPEPALHEEGQSQAVYVRFMDDRCTISLDATGEPLYKRGHKTHATAASLRETTAALILLEAHFMNYPVVVDPMCGSGTFGIEALEMAAGLVPGRDRTFAFMCWPAFSKKSFNYLIKNQIQQQKTLQDIKVFMSDTNDDSVKTALHNCSTAGISNLCQPVRHDFFSDVLPGTTPEKPALMVLNPPYGKRLENENIKKLYRKIGEMIRNNYPRWGYAIICPGLEVEKALSLSHDRKILFMNGGIKVSVIIKDAPDL